MRTKGLKSTVAIKPPRVALAFATGAVLVLAGAGLSRAAAGGAPYDAHQPRLPAHFSGLINDYSGTQIGGTTMAIAGSPYEMHGKWALDLNEARGTATFTAEISMETADFANPDPKGNHDPTQLKPHTHHILVTGGTIHNDPTGDPINWVSSCPALSPAMKGGFVIKGAAYVTGNGATAPFGNPNGVTICVLGGVSAGMPSTASVTYSNLTLTFDPAPEPPAMSAASHFGNQAINGVVVNCSGGPGRSGWGPRSSACSVAVVPE